MQLDVERLALEVELARSNAEATRSQLALAEDRLQRQQALVERGVAAETSVNELRTNAQALRATRGTDRCGPVEVAPSEITADMLSAPQTN